MKTLISIIIFSSLFWGGDAFAQTGYSAKNSIYLELLGNGVFYSVNYERALSQSLRGRIGFMSGGLAFKAICLLIPCYGDEQDRFNLAPLTVNYIHGKGEHKFEIGLGVAIAFGAKGEFDFDFNDVIIIDQTTRFLGTGTIGYRFQPETRGTLFRLGFTPLFSNKGVLPWGGMTIGYAW